MPKISNDEALEHLVEIDKMDDTDEVAISARCSHELAGLKTAYADFMSVWQGAVNALPEGIDPTLKVRLVTLAQAPKVWQTKDWCAAAVHAVAPRTGVEPAQP